MDLCPKIPSRVDKTQANSVYLVIHCAYWTILIKNRGKIIHMLCKALIIINTKTGKMQIPCGQCLPCKINKGRKWTCRLLMEENMADHSIFVTLSYRDSELPSGDNLQKTDLQHYIRRLRHAGIKFRYFAIGEYGSKNGRSHYHLALFGAEMMETFGTSYAHKQKNGYATHKDKYWKKGRVHIGELNTKTAKYIVGYTTKKMTEKHDKIINGRIKEFNLTSRRPALGTAFIENACRQVLQASRYHDEPAHEAIKLFEARRIRISQGIWPLDRQMLKTVYRCLGSSGDGPQQKIIRNQLRTLVGEWTGQGDRDKAHAIAVADCTERRLTRTRIGDTF